MILAAEDIENFLFVSHQKKNSVHLIITLLILSLSVCQVSTPDVCNTMHFFIWSFLTQYNWRDGDTV